MNLNSIIKEVETYVKSELNLSIEKTQLKTYTQDQWTEFCSANKFDSEAEGLFVPISLSAYVNQESSVLISNVFHEYFGHGLFCEHSSIGKDLVDICKRQGNAEAYLMNHVDRRTQYSGLCRQNINNYEGFAVWLESLLCKETGNIDIWKQKKENKISSRYLQLLDYFQEEEQRLTRFGFLAQMGFPKIYASEQIVDTIRHIYGNHFTDVQFIILYGSQHPESDIDLFIVANNPMQFTKGWLDIYEVSEDRFNNLINNLDISVTDPLFSGQVIYGNENLVEETKKYLLTAPITEKAIRYNAARSEEQKKLLSQIEEYPEEKKACLSYIESFKKNSIALEKETKVFTLNQLNQSLF